MLIINQIETIMNHLEVEVLPEVMVFTEAEVLNLNMIKVSLGDMKGISQEGEEDLHIIEVEEVDL
jgi:hypothetical protein